MERSESTSTRSHILGVNPHWKTYEEVEKYVSDDSKGLLWLFLPNRIWEWVHQPPDIDPEAIADGRNTVYESYREIEATVAKARRQVTEQAGAQIPSDNGELELDVVMEFDRQNYPATSKSPDSYISPKSYIDGMKQAVECEQATVSTIERLLSLPESAFLYEKERSFLRSAKSFFDHSLELGEIQISKVTAQRSEVIEYLEARIDDWERGLAKFDSRAQPYVELKKYLDDEGLLNELKTFQSSIHTIRDSFAISLKSHPVAHRFEKLEQRVSALLADLENSRKAYAIERLEIVVTETECFLNSLEQRLTPAKLLGAPIQSPERLLTQIDAHSQRLNDVRQAPYSVHIASTQLESLQDFEAQLRVFEQFILEKQWFDREIGRLATSFDELLDAAGPYLDYSQYLTRPVQTELGKRSDEFLLDVTKVTEEADFSILCSEDQSRLESLHTDCVELKTHLRAYNPEFVRREREACKQLFQEIGPNKLELTREQEEAVIRNGIYNQIIAAAGTGKTLTLITRVAYLIARLGIHPEQILVVTYTREAANEIRERLADHFGITAVEVRTIHSFGRTLIQASQPEQVSAIDPDQKINLIDRVLREERESPAGQFLDHYYEFLVHFDDVYIEEASFETKEEYVTARAEQTHTTLKGERVKSRAEKLIADFLFIHQVPYRYEDLATWAETAADKGEYSPDFHLPEHDVYIEHWGIDESGSIAPWFSWSSEEYHEKMQWARDEFSRSDFSLVETYEFEHDVGRLKQVLEHRLTLLGVELEKMSFEELVDAAYDYESREGYIKRKFRSFIDNARRFELLPDAIENNLSERNPRQYHFGQCGIRLLKEYVLFLHENELIDFTDMVQNATAMVRQNPAAYQDQYEHILVDEFQDVGIETMQLLQELTGETAAKLFAVGDDWQSIYSFQGAVLEYFTSFETHFGPPVRTDLTANFRSPPQIINAGNHLIQHNSGQLEKGVRATQESGRKPRVHSLQGYSDHDYARRVRDYALNLISQYVSNGSKPSEIMVLCRYDAAVPYLEDIKEGLRTQGIPYVGKQDSYRGSNGAADDGVSVYSLYQAKGREAKHVILVHTATGPYGFPPDARDEELLKPVQPLDLGGMEEERRAFYVAITRAEETLDLLTKVDHESPFLEEISDFAETVEAGRVEPLDEVGETMTVTAKVTKILDPWSRQHQRGYFTDRYGGSARFVSWTSSDPPDLEKDNWYTLAGVKVGKYKGEKELIIEDESTVTLHLERPQLGEGSVFTEEQMHLEG